MYAIDLPIARDNHNSISKFHDLCMRVSVQDSYRALRPAKVRSFVIVADDLERFCGSVMQWTYFLMPRPGLLARGLVVMCQTSHEPNHQAVRQDSTKSIRNASCCCDNPKT